MKNFEEILDSSMGVQLILAGLTSLVEDEGMTTRESFVLLEEIKRQSFHALNKICRGED